MKLRYEFVINDIAGEKVAIPVGENIDNPNFFLKLNETGVYILEMLKNDVTVEEIVASIKNDFKVEPEQDIEKIVNNFITKLKEANVLE